ncbi:MAG: WYL domain-containing protein [Dysgonamonadaceae bacterium]|jgi:predicted DNA-binding transcriptional regulator YafY|nr:WYL domain-containing protein [Dysgonamonadaceae bacterium]
MAKNLFDRYIWLVDTIYRAGKITFEEINEKWLRNEMSEGNEIPLRTFHNHRQAIETMFDINIDCDRRNGYVYYIGNKDDIERGGVRSWLLNTFAVNNLINESHKLKSRILFEEIPSGQRFLTPFIEAMRDGLRIEITYQSFRKSVPNTFEIEPYCVKVFKQRWYVLARSPYDNVLRIYSLDRIQYMQATNVPFKLPDDFNAQAYFENSFGIIADENIKPYTVKIKVFGNQRKYLQTLPLHHSQEEIEITEEYSVFRYFISPTIDFRQEILSYGDEIEVLSPNCFREEMARVALKMNELYK